MKVGIKKISELSGFSLATVSNVLNHKKGVNQQTADLILKIAHEIGYLKENCVKTIKLVIYKKHGMVVSDTPFFSALIEGVEGECRSRGFALEICSLDQHSRDFEAVLNGLLRDYSSAILLLATELDEQDMRPFESAVPPVMVLDNWFSNMKFNSVLINNTDSVYGAVRYLVSCGHRKIGYLKSAVSINNFDYRAEGYLSAMRHARLVPDEAYTVRLTPTMDGAYQDMCAYLNGTPAFPTAYFADNDIIALGAVKALKQHGIKIPQDISLIGFDDMPFCEIASPALTTIRVFKQEMGALAVKNLADSFQQKNPIRIKAEVCTAFIVRGSVKRL